MKWFGSSGIRGPYPEKIDTTLAMALGRATGEKARRILLGHDVRLTSPLLSQAFQAGALSVGATLTDGRHVATPSVAYGARDHDVGVTVTASHNPPPDNGFKFWNPDGSAWSDAQATDLEAALEKAPRLAPWDRVGRTVPDSEVTDRHRDALLRFTGSLSGRVVLDCGNGAGGLIAPRLLADAGLEVTGLFLEPDGRFPNRPSEPSSENLAALRAACRNENTWGVAHDGDADRMVPVDPHGDVVPPERVLVALALLRRAKHLVVPVDASLAFRDALPEASWTLCRVGDAAVSATLREQRGDLGGETSGTYVVPAFDYAPDGPLAALLFLKAAHEGLVAEAQRRLWPTHRLSQKLAIGTVDVESYRAALARIPSVEGATTSRIDGLRVDRDDGWFLIRPSGTEPLVRLTAEAWTADAAKARLDEARTTALSALEQSQAPLTQR